VQNVQNEMKEKKLYYKVSSPNKVGAHLLYNNNEVLNYTIHKLSRIGRPLDLKKIFTKDSSHKNAGILFSETMNDILAITTQCQSRVGCLLLFGLTAFVPCYQ
tara:strand:+ start:262 stop:570 length:309 start_codon:yes stop_codon:yes gene_type:complete